MELLKPYGLVLILPWRILICDRDDRRCQGVPYSKFAHHRTFHSNEKAAPKSRNSMSASTVEQLKILKVRKDFKDFPRPSTIIEPIPFLDTVLGLECCHSDCTSLRFVHRSRNMMQRHFRENHPISRNEQVDNFCMPVMCQSFVAEPANYPSWWFRVAAEVPLQIITASKGASLIGPGPDMTDNTFIGRDEFTAADGPATGGLATSDDFDALLSFHANHPPHIDNVEAPETSVPTGRTWADELKWDSLFVNAKPADLKERVMGNEDLKRAVGQYITDAMAELHTINQVTLRQLLQRHTGHKKVLFLEEKENISAHVSTWTSFLGMVLQDREQPIPFFPCTLSSEVRRSAKSLATNLTARRAKGNEVQLIHALVFALLSTNDSGISKSLEASPLFRFVAINSQSNSKVVDPTTASSRMAPLQYVFRLSAVFQGCLDAKTNHDSNIEECIAKRLQWVRAGTLNTWHVLQHMKGVAARHILKEIKEVRIEWSADGKRFLYTPLGETLEMNDLHTFFHSVQTDSKAHLRDILLKDVPTHTVEKLWEALALNKVMDNIACPDVNYSFLTDPRNAFPSQGHLPLLQALMESRPGYFGTPKTSVAPGECPIEWNAPNISEWCRHADEGTEFHIVGSWTQCPASSRGTEMAEAKLKNISTREREVVYVDHHLTYASGYNKTTNLTGFDKTILRAPSKDLGDQMAFFLAYIRPLLVFWAPIAYPKVADAASSYEEYLWVTGGRKWESKDITTVLKKFTEAHLEIADLGIEHWRHIAIAIIRRHLAMMASDGEALEDMMAHGQNLNSKVEWDNPALLREYATLCNKWHRFWGFDRKDKSTALFIAPELDPASRRAAISDAVTFTKRSIVSLEKKLDNLTAQG
ncbi:hypothetical protein DFH06DRAFT_1319273 [Mycena polygramma]|nr:hypothetical protein DFH06DRAFT_1319273 [Mycena polygramma]